MSTEPAFPASDSETFFRDRAVIGRAFLHLREVRYGAFRTVRNLSAGLLCLGSGAQAESVTVVAFGDSLTAGYGLAADDGFVPQMQAWLDDQGADVVLVNAGVSGDTTAGGLARTDWTLTDDVDAMILALGANDYLRGFDPALTEENLSGILDKAANRDVDVLLVGLVVGANYGPGYKAEFDAIFPNLAAAYKTDYAPQWFSGIIDVVGSGEGMTAYMQSDGLHPNAEGVQLIVEALGPSVLALTSKPKS